MKIGHMALLILSGYSLISPSIQATELSLQWQEPETYRDIRANSFASQTKFQDSVIAALTDYLQLSADKYLPAGQKLNMTITDVDLAGDVDYFYLRYNEGIRVVKNLYFPSMKFSYELLDSNGTVLRSGEESIKDMGFLYAVDNRINSAPFNYEKHMIDNWFHTNFEQPQ